MIQKWQFWLENVKIMKIMILVEIWKSSNLSKHWYWSSGISLEEMRTHHYFINIDCSQIKRVIVYRNNNEMDKMDYLSHSTKMIHSNVNIFWNPSVQLCQFWLVFWTVVTILKVHDCHINDDLHIWPGHICISAFPSPRKRSNMKTNSKSYSNLKLSETLNSP